MKKWLFSASANLMALLKLASDPPCCHGNKSFHISVHNLGFCCIKADDH